MDSIKINTCEFSVRTLNALHSMGVHTLGELKSYSSIDLLEFRGFGRHSLREVRKVLAKYGFSLRGDILFSSEEHKRLIEDIPNTLKEILSDIRECERKLKTLNMNLEQVIYDLTERKS